MADKVTELLLQAVARIKELESQQNQSSFAELNADNTRLHLQVVQCMRWLRSLGHTVEEENGQLLFDGKPFGGA